MHVGFHENVRDGAVVAIWDTPGLDDSSQVDPRTVINELREKAGNNLDLVLYCIAYIQERITGRGGEERVTTASAKPGEIRREYYI